MYICNSYYMEYNFALNLAMHLAASLELPCIVILIRPSDEFIYPFTHHTQHILSHLSWFHDLLTQFSVTPLLFFSTSLSHALLHIYSEMSPFFLITDPFPDIRFSAEFSSFCANDESLRHCLLVVDNACSTLPISSSSPFFPPFPSLSPMIQLSVAYSLNSPDSISRGDDFTNCVLILPPFLATPDSPRKKPREHDFTFGAELRTRHVVANWGDLRHEATHRGRPWNLTELLIPRGYRRFVKEGVLDAIRGGFCEGFVSEFTVAQKCDVAQLAQLSQMVSERNASRRFFAENLSICGFGAK